MHHQCITSYLTEVGNRMSLLYYYNTPNSKDVIRQTACIKYRGCGLSVQIPDTSVTDNKYQASASPGCRNWKICDVKIIFDFQNVHPQDQIIPLVTQKYTN